MNITDDQAVEMVKAIVNQAQKDLDRAFRRGKIITSQRYISNTDMYALNQGMDAIKFFNSAWFSQLMHGLNEYYLKRYKIPEKSAKVISYYNEVMSWQEEKQ